MNAKLTLKFMGNYVILLMVWPPNQKWYQNFKNGFEIKKCIKNDKIQNKNVRIQWKILFDHKQNLTIFGKFLKSYVFMP